MPPAGALFSCFTLGPSNVTDGKRDSHRIGEIKRRKGIRPFVHIGRSRVVRRTAAICLDQIETVQRDHARDRDEQYCPYPNVEESSMCHVGY